MLRYSAWLACCTAPACMPTSPSRPTANSSTATSDSISAEPCAVAGAGRGRAGRAGRCSAGACTVGGLGAAQAGVTQADLPAGADHQVQAACVARSGNAGAAGGRDLKRHVGADRGGRVGGGRQTTQAVKGQGALAGGDQCVAQRAAAGAALQQVGAGAVADGAGAVRSRAHAAAQIAHPLGARADQGAAVAEVAGDLQAHGGVAARAICSPLCRLSAWLRTWALRNQVEKAGITINRLMPRMARATINSISVTPRIPRALRPDPISNAPLWL